MSGPTGAQEKPEPLRWTLAPWETRVALREALQAHTRRFWEHDVTNQLVCYDIRVAVYTRVCSLRADIWFPLCPTGPGTCQARKATLEVALPGTPVGFANLAFWIDGQIRQEYQQLDAEHQRVAQQYDRFAGDPYQTMETP